MFLLLTRLPTYVSFFQTKGILYHREIPRYQIFFLCFLQTLLNTDQRGPQMIQLAHMPKNNRLSIPHLGVLKDSWWLVFGIQAFSQDLKSGRPKYTVNRACSNEKFIRQHIKTKRFSSISGCPQDTWMPIWLKGCLHQLRPNQQKLSLHPSASQRLGNLQCLVAALYLASALAWLIDKIYTERNSRIANKVLTSGATETKDYQ